MTRIAGQHVGPHQQNADGSAAIFFRARQFTELVCNRHFCARVIQPHIGVGLGSVDLELTAQAALLVGVAIDQRANEIDDIDLRPGEPVLHREKIGAHVLRRARDKLQYARQPRQHGHLFGTDLRFLFGTATQFFQKRQRSARLARHRKLAKPRQLHDFAVAHEAHHGVALIAARLERWQNRLDVLIHKQHACDHQIGLLDVAIAACHSLVIARPFAGTVQAEFEIRNLNT